MRNHFATTFPIYGIFALLMVVGACKCNQKPVEQTYDTISDTVYKSYINGKLFGTEVQFRKRKSIKDYRNEEK